jgi:hypothetical protein
LTPPPNAIGQAFLPNQGCFDDHDGDNSVDWVFYEDLYDELSTMLCFDRNRVFSVGIGGGGWFSNELGCKYAGDSQRPIRGIMATGGGLPNQPAYEPTCTTLPMAGMWVHEPEDTVDPFSGTEFAVTRAMRVNQCTQTTFSGADFASFPIGGGNADTVCRSIQNCPTIYPLVVCPIPGTRHMSNDLVASPGFSTFIAMFENAPFLTK